MTEKERQEIKSRGFEDLTNITEKELNSLNLFDQIEIYIKSFRNINYVFDKDKKLLYAELYDVYCNSLQTFHYLIIPHLSLPIQAYFFLLSNSPHVLKSHKILVNYFHI